MGDDHIVLDWLYHIVGMILLEICVENLVVVIQVCNLHMTICEVLWYPTCSLWHDGYDEDDPCDNCNDNLDMASANAHYDCVVLVEDNLDVLVEQRMCILLNACSVL